MGEVVHQHRHVRRLHLPLLHQPPYARRGGVHCDSDGSQLEVVVLRHGGVQRVRVLLSYPWAILGRIFFE